MSEERGYARLSTSKSAFQPILCSQCHYEFGFVFDEARSPGRGPARTPDADLQPRKIYLWRGWRSKPVNGVVSFTKHALERLRRGEVPRNRRGDENGEHIADSPRYDLPAVLLCPQCGERQTLDKDRLNADRVHEYERDEMPRIVKLSRGSVGRQGSS